MRPREGQEVPPVQAKQGMLICRVNSGSPAEKAGLKPGDEIIDIDGCIIRGLDVSMPFQWGDASQVMLSVRREDTSVAQITVALEVKDGAKKAGFIFVPIPFRIIKEEPDSDGEKIIREDYSAVDKSGKPFEVTTKVWRKFAVIDPQNPESGRVDRYITGLAITGEKDGDLKTADLFELIEPKNESLRMNFDYSSSDGVIEAVKGIAAKDVNTNPGDIEKYLLDANDGARFLHHYNYRRLEEAETLFDRVSNGNPELNLSEGVTEADLSTLAALQERIKEAMDAYDEDSEIPLNMREILPGNYPYDIGRAFPRTKDYEVYEGLYKLIETALLEDDAEYEEELKGAKSDLLEVILRRLDIGVVTDEQVSKMIQRIQDVIIAVAKKQRLVTKLKLREKIAKPYKIFCEEVNRRTTALLQHIYQETGINLINTEPAAAQISGQAASAVSEALEAAPDSDGEGRE